MKWLTSRFLVSSVCAAITFNLVSSTEAVSSDYDDPHLPNDRTRDSKAVSFFTEAVQLLESMNTSSSCSRMATTELISSCQDLEGTDTTRALEHIRSVFAVRLAICELEGAGAGIPQPCVPVIAPHRSPSDSGVSSWFQMFKSQNNDETIVPKKDLERCLRNLESKAQWWTSYSNNRQNTMVICQASRAQAEREETLRVYQSLAKVSFNLTKGFKEFLREAAEDSAEYRAFVQAEQAHRERLSTELEEFEERGTSAFGKILDVATAIASVLSKTNMESSQIRENLQNVTSDAVNLKQVLRDTQEDEVSQIRQNLQNATSDAVDLKQVLQDTQDDEVARHKDRVARDEANLEAAAELHTMITKSTRFVGWLQAAQVFFILCLMLCLLIGQLFSSATRTLFFFNLGGLITWMYIYPILEPYLTSVMRI